jgi:hypothetical protein
MASAASSKGSGRSLGLPRHPASTGGGSGGGGGGGAGVGAFETQNPLRSRGASTASGGKSPALGVGGGSSGGKSPALGVGGKSPALMSKRTSSASLANLPELELAGRR